MAAAFVELGENETALELAGLLASSAGQTAVTSAMESLLRDGNVGGALTKALEDPSLFFKIQDQKAVEGVWAMLFTSALTLGEQERNAVVDKAVTVLIDSGENAALRVRILSTLINMLRQSNTKVFATYKTMISYAADHGLGADVVESFAVAAAQAEQWGASRSERESLLAQFAEIASAAGQSSAEVLRWQKARIELVEEASSSTNSAAVALVRSAIAEGSVFRFDDILATRAVSALEKSEPGLFKLLQLLVRGTWKEYAAFTKENASVFSKNNIDQARCDRKMRLLSVVDLCSGKGTVGISDVQENIDVPADEVESWIITATSEGLLDARVDQAAGVITVSRASPREFSDSEWKKLAADLREWKSAIGKIVRIVDTSMTRNASGTTNES